MRELNRRELNRMNRLKAVQNIKNNPYLLSLMAEFKKVSFTGSYILNHQIENEEELALIWLSEIENQLFECKDVQ
jgi:hypothetical protein